MTRVPDCVAPIVGYRVWQWDTAGLKSLNMEPWCPGEALVASCRLARQRSSFGAAGENSTHEVPHPKCSCGVYATRGSAHLLSAGYDQYGIQGEVYLWGSVIEHEKGWRAQYAYPKSLTVPIAMLPVAVRRIEAQLSSLVAYGCDILISDHDETIPLWTKGLGYASAGLEQFIQRSQAWYGRHARQQRIRSGDRVAVLGHGIAVVDDADHLEIRARLWNRKRIRISRKRVVWNEQNNRWETCTRSC